MAARKLVSIVIPIYNVEKYLRSCVDSALSQTYGHLEIILVDDGSPDGCGAICDEYAAKDARVRVIHKPNGGLSDARNAGFGICSGEYVYFLDSDDMILETAIEELVLAAEENQADFVFFDAVSLFENPSDSAARRDDRYIRKHSYERDKGYRVLNKLRNNAEFRSAVPLTFIRTDFIRRYALAFYKGILHEDELYTSLLFLYADGVAHLPRALYIRRERAGSIMTVRRTARNAAGYITVYLELLRLYTQGGLRGEVKEALRRRILIMFVTAAGVYHSLDAGEKKKAAADKKRLYQSARDMRYFHSPQVRIICLNYGLYRLLAWLRKRITFRPRQMMQKRRNASQDRTLLRALRQNGKQRRLVLIGTPGHGNLGDHAIALAEHKLLRDARPDLQVVEIPMSNYLRMSAKLWPALAPQDIVAISGGGWLGTLWQHNEDVVRGLVENCPNNRIIIFPQTVYYEQNENGRAELQKAKDIYPRHKNLIFCLRDRESYDFVLKNGLVSDQENCLYIPDMVLYLDASDRCAPRDGVLVCFRQDHEKLISRGAVQDILAYLQQNGFSYRRTSTNLRREVGLAQRETAVREKLAEFAGSRLVITDRLHSMLFAAITGTPCIALDNLTGKVKGVYQWIQGLEYVRFAETPEEALGLIPELIELNHSEFHNDGFVEMFGKLAQRI